MKELIKSLLTQQIINSIYHLPKAILANIVYGFSARGLKVIGVTGTDGKTTTTNMIYQILKKAGKRVSMVSTVNAVIAGKEYDTGFHVTSPDPFMVQRFAQAAKTHHDQYLILEVTSHALDQFRFWGINFEAGVITNITHEHLDYHKSFENYSRTKLKLLNGVKTAIVNQAIKEIRKLGDQVITFGLNKGDFNQQQIKLDLKIPGDYNIENALAAMTVAVVLGIDRKVAQISLENFSGVTGRMEEVKNKLGIKIYIDFAHTPNGLEKALRALRYQFKSGKLLAVFGSAGQRDVYKRSVMGEIAGRLADLMVITAEDPRGELEIINNQIVAGIKKSGGKEGVNYFVINDRQKAIYFAVNCLAKKGDILGIFGKGHERSMNLDGKKEIPWSDLEAVEEALQGNQGN